MSEWALVYWIPIRLVVIIIFAFCYCWGGRKNKWVRRFIGGLFLPSACILLAFWFDTFHWWMFFGLVAYPVVLSLGYGSDTFQGKFIKRLIYGLLFGSCSFLFGSWIMGLCQVIISIGLNLMLGLLNPVQAVNEEACIASGSTFLVPFMI